MNGLVTTEVQELRAGGTAITLVVATVELASRRGEVVPVFFGVTFFTMTGFFTTGVEVALSGVLVAIVSVVVALCGVTTALVDVASGAEVVAVMSVVVPRTSPESPPTALPNDDSGIVCERGNTASSVCQSFPADAGMAYAVAQTRAD